MDDNKIIKFPSRISPADPRTRRIRKQDEGISPSLYSEWAEELLNSDQGEPF